MKGDVRDEDLLGSGRIGVVWEGIRKCCTVCSWGWDGEWVGFGVGEVGELFVCGYWEILVLA